MRRGRLIKEFKSEGAAEFAKGVAETTEGV